MPSKNVLQKAALVSTKDSKSEHLMLFNDVFTDVFLDSPENTKCFFWLLFVHSCLSNVYFPFLV